MILWAKPNRPVLPAYSGPGTGLLVDKPAPAQQLNGNLRKLADAAGLVERIVSHDLRRGAARDHAYLPESNITASTAAAGAFIRHSEMSTELSLTKKYVGDQRHSTIHLRLETPADTDVDNFSINFAPGSYQVPRTTGAQTIAWMKEQGLESFDYNSRQAAGRAMRKEVRQTWAHSAGNSPLPLRSQTSSQINAKAPNSKGGHVSSTEVTDLPDLELSGVDIVRNSCENGGGWGVGGSRNLGSSREWVERVLFM